MVAHREMLLLRCQGALHLHPKNSFNLCCVWHRERCGNCEVAKWRYRCILRIIDEPCHWVAPMVAAGSSFHISSHGFRIIRYMPEKNGFIWKVGSRCGKTQILFCYCSAGVYSAPWLLNTLNPCPSVGSFLRLHFGSSELCSRAGMINCYFQFCQSSASTVASIIEQSPAWIWVWCITHWGAVALKSQRHWNGMLPSLSGGAQILTVSPPPHHPCPPTFSHRSCFRPCISGTAALALSTCQTITL